MRQHAPCLCKASFWHSVAILCVVLVHCVVNVQALWYADGGSAPCRRCPLSGVQCAGGTLQLLPGYFRPPSHALEPIDETAELHECLQPDRCIVNDTSRAYSCVEGTTGPLCSLCDADKGFAAIGNACIQCPPQELNQFLVFAMAGSAFIVLGIVVVRQRSQARHDDSIALRILLTHVQAVGSMRAFQISGTALFKRVMAWSEVLSPAVVSQGPTQCAVRPSFAGVFFSTVFAPVIASMAAMVILFLSLLVHKTKDSGKRTLRHRVASCWRDRVHVSIMLFIAQ